jgi:hypothetical protein
MIPLRQQKRMASGRCVRPSAVPPGRPPTAAPDAFCAARERARRSHETPVEELAARRAYALEYPADQTEAREALLQPDDFGPTTLQAFAAAWNRLCPDTRTIIDLFYRAGLPHAEIGRRMNLDPHVVRERQRRGILSLRRQLTSARQHGRRPRKKIHAGNRRNRDIPIPRCLSISRGEHGPTD